MITFIISVVADNDDVNNVLAFGPTGMFFFLLTVPWRRYSYNGFYKVDFKDSDINIVKTVYSRGGEKAYQKLMITQETLGTSIEPYLKRVKFKEYLQGRILTR